MRVQHEFTFRQEFTCHYYVPQYRAKREASQRKMHKILWAKQNEKQ